jgi:hypothetical protein
MIVKLASKQHRSCLSLHCMKGNTSVKQFLTHDEAIREGRYIVYFRRAVEAFPHPFINCEIGFPLAERTTTAGAAERRDLPCKARAWTPPNNLSVLHELHAYSKATPH